MTIEPLFHYADRVRTGDVIRWCGRPVTVTHREVVGSPYHRRPAVYLTVEADDVPQRRLHYYADEMVEMADAE